MRLLDIGTYFTSDLAIGRELDDDDLRALYAPEVGRERPWIRVNFVSSLDGSVTADGRSGGLGTPSDARVFAVLREMCDAVLVGAGTVRAENYGGVQMSDAARARRVERGASPTPPIVVVTGSASIDADARVLTDTEVPPVIVTSTAADGDRVAALRTAGAQVMQVDGDTVSTSSILEALIESGFRNVLCEGGPSLFGRLIADGAADELCLTLSPTLVAGDAGRIAHASDATDTSLVRAHVIGDDDGTLLTRWVRPSGGDEMAASKSR